MCTLRFFLSQLKYTFVIYRIVQLDNISTEKRKFRKVSRVLQLALWFVFADILTRNEDRRDNPGLNHWVRLEFQWVVDEGVSGVYVFPGTWMCQPQNVWGFI